MSTVRVAILVAVVAAAFGSCKKSSGYMRAALEPVASSTGVHVIQTTRSTRELR